MSRSVPYFEGMAVKALPAPPATCEWCGAPLDGGGPENWPVLADVARAQMHWLGEWFVEDKLAMEIWLLRSLRPEMTLRDAAQWLGVSLGSAAGAWKRQAKRLNAGGK